MGQEEPCPRHCHGRRLTRCHRYHRLFHLLQEKA